MGYHDSEFVNSMSLFQINIDSLSVHHPDLRERMQEGEGQPLQRLEQIDCFYDDLNEEPWIRLEFDRFLPGLIQPNH